LDRLILLPLSGEMPETNLPPASMTSSPVNFSADQAAGLIEAYFAKMYTVSQPTTIALLCLYRHPTIASVTQAQLHFCKTKTAAAKTETVTTDIEINTEGREHNWTLPT